MNPNTITLPGVDQTTAAEVQALRTLTVEDEARRLEFRRALFRMGTSEWRRRRPTADERAQRRARGKAQRVARRATRKAA